MDQALIAAGAAAALVVAWGWLGRRRDLRHDVARRHPIANRYRAPGWTETP